MPDDPEMQGKQTRPIAEMMQQYVTLTLNDLQQRQESFWGRLFDKLTRKTTGALTDLEASTWDMALGNWQDIGIIDEETRKWLTKFSEQPFPSDAIHFLLINLSLLTQFLSVHQEPVKEKIRQRINADTRPNLPRMEEILRAAFIAPEKTEEVVKVLQKHGFSEESIKLLFISQYQTYDVDTIRILYHRGKLDKPKVFERMRELGFTDTRIKEIMESWPVIPPVTDILTMVAKEAYDLEIVRKWGFDDELETVPMKTLRKHGLSDEWSTNYWRAHWEMPSLEMGMEMLHRGIIELDDLKLLFRVVEIPPYWRDKLLKVAYRPYTRVDVRRMEKAGVLTVDDLVRAYKDIGYDEEKAGKMAEFTLAFNRGAEKDLAKGEVLKGYRKKVIAETDAMTMLQKMRYSEDEARYLLRMEDYKEEEEQQDDAVDNIKLRFQENLIDAREARRHLDELNLPAAQTNLLMDKWEIKRFIDRKLPSKTDLDKFWRAGIIGEDVYTAEMLRLGYSSRQVDWYRQLQHKQQETKQNALTQKST